MSPLDLNSFIFFWFINVLRAENKGDWELCSDLSSNMTGLYLDGGWENKKSGSKNANVLPSNCSPLLSSSLLFWLSFVACGILVLQPGIEPGSPAVEIWSPNHWTAREFPAHPYFWVIERRKWERHSQKIIFWDLKYENFWVSMLVPLKRWWGWGGGAQLPQTPHSEVPSVLHTLSTSSTLNLFVPDGFFSFSSSALRAVPVLTVSKHQINP